VTSPRLRLSGDVTGVTGSFIHPGRRYEPASNELLRWLTAGRPEGPVFLTSRRAPAGTPAVDICPLTGRARLSYRRAAEVFTEVTRLLDAAGRGWTLSRLRPAGSS
jgi:hypothetical protein